MGWICGKKSDERSRSDSSRIKCRVLFISFHSFPFFLIRISPLLHSPSPSAFALHFTSCPISFALSHSHSHLCAITSSSSTSVPLEIPLSLPLPRPLQFHLNFLFFPDRPSCYSGSPSSLQIDPKEIDESRRYEMKGCKNSQSQRNLALFQ